MKHTISFFVDFFFFNAICGLVTFMFIFIYTCMPKCRVTILFKLHILFLLFLKAATHRYNINNIWFLPVWEYTWVVAAALYT